MNTIIFVDTRKFRYPEDSLVAAVRDYVAQESSVRFFVFKKPSQSFPEDFTVLGVGQAEDYSWLDKIPRMVAQICNEHRENTIAYVLSYDNQVLRSIESIESSPALKVFPVYLGKINNAYRERVANQSSAERAASVASGNPHPSGSGPAHVIPLIPAQEKPPVVAPENSPDLPLWKVFLGDFMKAKLGASPETRSIFCTALQTVVKDQCEPMYVPDLFIESQGIAMELAQKRGYEREKSLDAARKGMMRLMIRAKVLNTSIVADQLDDYRAERALVNSLAENLGHQIELYLVYYAFKVHTEIHRDQLADLGIAIYHQGKDSGVHVSKLEGKVRKLVRCLEQMGSIEFDELRGVYGTVTKPVAVGKAAE